MAISEKKMQIVIDNYFKSECDVNTSIRQAFEKGFRIGVMKGQCSQENKGEWIPISSIDEIPKEGAYWVTFEYENGYRETSHIGWDKFHEHWDDEEGWALDNEDYIIAYMPYFEPEPFKWPEGE